MNTRDKSAAKPQDRRLADDEKKAIKWEGITFKVSRSQFRDARVLWAMEREQLMTALSLIVSPEKLEQVLSRLEEKYGFADVEKIADLFMAMQRELDLKN